MLALVIGAVITIIWIVALVNYDGQNECQSKGYDPEADRCKTCCFPCDYKNRKKLTNRDESLSR